MNPLCPRCGASYTIDAGYIGRTFQCNRCGTTLIVLPAGLAITGPPAVAVPTRPPSTPEQDFAEVTNRESRPRSRSRRANTSSLADFFTFRAMITPLLIQLVFWLGTLGCFWLGTRSIIASMDTPRVTTWAADDDLPRFAPLARSSTSFSTLLFVQGIAVIILGPVLLRVACELDIILFRIHDELKEANDRARYRERD